MFPPPADTVFWDCVTGSPLVSPPRPLPAQATDGARAGFPPGPSLCLLPSPPSQRRCRQAKRTATKSCDRYGPGWRLAASVTPGESSGLRCLTPGRGAASVRPCARRTVPLLTAPHRPVRLRQCPGRAPPAFPLRFPRPEAGLGSQAARLTALRGTHLGGRSSVFMAVLRENGHFSVKSLCRVKSHF